MHVFADDAARGSDGIKARLELAEKRGEFLGRELGRGKLQQRVEHVSAPQILVEARLHVRIEQVLEELGRRVFLRDRREELLVRRGDHEALRQRLADRHGNLVGIRHDLVPAEAERLEDSLHQCRIVLRENSKRIADFVVEARALERDFEMARILLRPFKRELSIDRERGRKGIFARINSVCGHDGFE